MTSYPVEILLVEDNLADIELTVHALKANNVANRIQVATDGQQALDFLFGENADPVAQLENRPRVVLLDIKLPRMDGLEVLRRIKSNDNAKAIPVVMLTSSKEERDMKTAYQLGANSYIVKPVDFEQFTHAVREAGLYWMVLNEPPSV